MIIEFEDGVPRYIVGPNRHDDTIYMEPYGSHEVYISASSNQLFLTDEQMEELIMAYYDIKSGGKVAHQTK